MPDIYSIVDTFWVILCAMLVFFMNLGFACVETGMARQKNAVNILSKNFIVFAVASMGFMFLGWGLMFGGDHPFIGTTNLWILGGDTEFYADTLSSSIPFWGKFFFQLVFAGTAATIVSGAVAERVKYVSFIIFSLVLTLVIYPIVGHWVWGGGWLADMGFIDFAGDTVVHGLGGVAALSGAMILGPRIGKYGKNGKINAIPGHNMSLAVIGALILWLCWFGFNPGSTLSFQNPGDVVHVLVTTNSAAIAAMLVATGTIWIKGGKPDLGMTINGCLAGLVAITGGAQAVSVGSSLAIGAVAGLIVVFAVSFFDKIKIDDPVGATSVHLCCGIFGSLAVGLFAQEGVTSLSTVNGLFFGGGATQLGIQLLGNAAMVVFVFAASSAVWLVLKKTMGIRVTREEEIMGLDVGEHGNSAYPDFALATPRLVLDDAEGVMPIPFTPNPRVSMEQAVEVNDISSGRAKLTKVTVILNQHRLAAMQQSLEALGITGMTVTNVLGFGIQKGNTIERYRGVPVETRLLPKVQVDIVISKIPTDVLIDTIKRSLYTGSIGDGKIFVYDVENVVKVRTGEEGYDALQDVE
jgi:Amt family ammonium transporter